MYYAKEKTPVRPVRRPYVLWAFPTPESRAAWVQLRPGRRYEIPNPGAMYAPAEHEAAKERGMNFSP